MPRSILRLVRTVVLTAALLAVALVVARPPLPAVQASGLRQPFAQWQTGDGPNKAALAVRYDDDRVDSVCVSFSEDKITGGQLLERSELALVMSDTGLICDIEYESGCPSDDCLCQCASGGPGCMYWAYYIWGNGAWQYSQVGALGSEVKNGDLQAWSWGLGNAQLLTGAAAPNVTFDQICGTSAANPTQTPTATPTATPTFTPQAQFSGPATPPQVTFAAAQPIIPAQQCTVLTWSTLDATSVTLDGAAVALSGSERVCPQVSRTWTLVASNAAGQSTRQVSVQVDTLGASSQSPAAPTPSLQSSTATPRPVVPTGPNAIATKLPQPLPSGVPGQPELFTTPSGDLFRLEGGVPLAATAELLQPLYTPTVFATPTRYVFSPPPTDTPRPRRVLAAGAPTPTPLLVARAGGGSSQAPATKAGSSGSSRRAASQQIAQSRAFTPALLPQYAAYITSVAALLVMGWFTLRRRSRSPVAVTDPARDVERAPQGAGKE